MKDLFLKEALIINLIKIKNKSSVKNSNFEFSAVKFAGQSCQSPWRGTFFRNKNPPPRASSELDLRLERLTNIILRLSILFVELFKWVWEFLENSA